jgi:DNA invertase Pin-like site-specific DNA recombinase
MIIGYARISSGGDHALAQCEALKDAGCESIAVEKTKGAVIDQPKLEKLLSNLTEGDVLTVTRLDRLGYSLMQLNDLVKELAASGVTLRSLKENLDTGEPGSALFVQMLDTLAGMERAQVRERTQAGIERARKRGVPIGRPVIMTPSQIKHAAHLVETGESISGVARSFGVNRLTMTRALQRHKQSSQQ